ncbi:MAG: UDP-N-acetylglucosamine 1-carboxyvinyltransferase [Lachnospiraceae bacterium]
MKIIELEGKHKLEGSVNIQGSKNAVLPILSACVLNEGVNILHGCPKIRDVEMMLDILQEAGAKVCWQDHTLLIDTSVMNPVALKEKTGCMRASIMLLGSFLGRFGRAVLGYPGGCHIGKRPIDLHELSLSAMGAVFHEEEDFLEAECTKLEGCDIYLPYPSVGVTENLLLAGATASGMTRIFGAAREPEIVELCRFLKSMGVQIYGLGTNRLFVMGNSHFHNTEFTVARDRIVAGTYLLACAGAGGEILLRNAPLESMQSTVSVLNGLGAELKRDGCDVRMKMKKRPCSIPFLATAPYPGFPTDLQSPLLAALCTANGSSCMEERVFENRFLIVEELVKMGADVRTEYRRVCIRGVGTLQGGCVCARELRGGAALVIAGLEAEGMTTVEHAEIIERGYENITADLELLGAMIKCYESSASYEKM